MVPLTWPAIVPLVVLPGADPGAAVAVPLGEAALPEAVVPPDMEPLIPVVVEEEPVPVEAVELGIEVSVVVVVVVAAVELGVVVDVLGADVVVVVLGAVVLDVVLLRSQPAAAVASAMAAAIGIRRFMTSPFQCAN